VFPVRCLVSFRASVRKAILLRAFLIFFTVTSGLSWAGTEQVWLFWDDPAPELNIMEYHVFYGTQSGHYTSEDVVYYYPGDLIYGLEEGTNYFFAVMSVDINGNSSPLSPEISLTVPKPQPVPLQEYVYYAGDGAAVGMMIFATWDSPTDWELDYSTDLENWYPWESGHGTDLWTYADFSWGDQCYFRLALY
jgi:hypothetical protein